MASSSQPSASRVPTRGSTYDIFLSFRGEDTRNNFVDHLFAALDQKGIRTFKDDQMLGGGKPISPTLLKAIKESKFAIVVFSKNYANSSWCLEELSEIMECHDRMGLKVLPVFYHVDPSDVRKQKGNFAIDFQEHQQEQHEKWRKALTAAANISGNHISSVSGGESATINKIVKEILVGIQPRGTGREENLIGIESHIDKLISLLNIEAKDVVRTIGIHGMGGLGKTTIARALFRRIASKFEGSSFVSNVRENSSSDKDICALQEKILGDILGAQQGFGIQDPNYGADMIQERFCNKKVLLVLDDVDNEKQFEFLAATHDWFGLGSRIVVTTRDKHMLSDAEIVKYKPTLLSEDQALKLFCRHAFKENSPPDALSKLSYGAIRCTGRLPLALKVLGSFFHGREVDVWESALDRLSETPNKEVFTTLKLSFDGLEESEKKIFLDIAFFFKGDIVDDVTTKLDSFGFHPVVGIRILIEKSLITITNNRLGMHDLIQEMGWQIVREIAPNSRLQNEEVVLDLTKKSKVFNHSDYLALAKDFELIEAIVLPWKRKHDDLNVGVDLLANMKNLRWLETQGKFTIRKPTILPDELRWLWWYSYPFSCLPLSNTTKLVGLEIINGEIKHLWTGQKKWAARDGCLSICIPGSKIPRWFKEQQNGSKIALKLPSEWQTQIIGFAICSVFVGKYDLSVGFTFENGEQLELDSVNASTTSSVNNKVKDVWIGYVPLSLLGNMHRNNDDDDCECQDWSHFNEGNVIIKLTCPSSVDKIISCGAKVVYKQELESIQKIIKPSISSSYYWNWKPTHSPSSRNTILCESCFQE